MGKGVTKSHVGLFGCTCTIHVSVKNKTSEVHSKLTNVIVVVYNKNQVKSPSISQLPKYKQLLSSLSPYHAKLVGESYLGKKRQVFECTEVQAAAAKGFLALLRSYLDSLCCNLRSRTITNVQSNDDKVSLLLKESFIDSFPSRERPFMKHFVDTQLFSVHRISFSLSSRRNNKETWAVGGLVIAMHCCILIASKLCNL